MIPVDMDVLICCIEQPKKVIIGDIWLQTDM